MSKKSIDSSDKTGHLHLLAKVPCVFCIFCSAISADLGNPANTIHRWIDALKRSFLFEIIESCSRNARQSLIKRLKIIVVDTTLAIAGAGHKKPSGFHFETMICIDLLHWRGERPNRGFNHWRSRAAKKLTSFWKKIKDCFLLRSKQEQKSEDSTQGICLLFGSDTKIHHAGSC